MEIKLVLPGAISFATFVAMPLRYRFFSIHVMQLQYNDILTILYDYYTTKQERYHVEQRKVTTPRP